MFNIRTYNEIARKGLKVFNNDHYQLNGVEEPDAILLRSHDLHKAKFSSRLKAVARAGAGVNNIPIDRLSQEGVVVFNTPGANANAVKELVIMSLIASSRHVVDAILWVNSLNGQTNIERLVEAGKKKYAGNEIYGKRLGVIGAGAIGVLVANDAHALGMDVVAFDPYISVKAAWQLSSNVKRAESLDEIFQTCDYITIHIPLTEDTKGMFNKRLFEKMKENARLFNFSRGELVNEEDLAEALEKGKPAAYVTDFPSERVLTMKNAVCLPHLGASTQEAEEASAFMAARQLKEFLETGNIQNSVNFPNLSMAYSGNKRITLAHRNIPNMVGQITYHIARHHLNITNMVNGSRGEWAYTMIDLDENIDQELERDMHRDFMKINGVTKVRFI